MEHLQVLKGLGVSFKPGAGASTLAEGHPLGLRGPASNINTGPECSALWPCPLRVYPLISWLQPLGVWPLAKGGLRLLYFVFQKGKAEIKKKKKRWGERERCWILVWNKKNGIGDIRKKNVARHPQTRLISMKCVL